MANKVATAGTYEKEMQRSLQNQFARVEKQSIQGDRIAGVNLNDAQDFKAVAPELPGAGEECLCFFCGGKIPEKRENVPQWVVDRERKFRTCQSCRGGIVGNGGALDQSTPNLAQERKFK